MRKIALTVLAAAGVSLAGAAQAADMAKVYRKAPPPVMTYMWQGSYIGLYAGGATGANDVVTGVPVTGAGAPLFVSAPASYKLGSSFIGGFTSGYNWQLSPNWVVGYESEKGYMSLTGATTYAGSATTTARTSIGSLYSAWTGRVGYAWDRSLIYAKGGLVMANFETGATDPTVGAHLDTIGRKTSFGYTVGGGWEYALDPKWSLKAEYLYFGFDKNITTTGNATPGVQQFTTTALSGIHTGKVGLNYKFDMWGYILGGLR